MNNGLNSPGPDKFPPKYKENVLKYIIRRIEKGTGLSLQELHREFSEEDIFYLGLKHITTTKKAFCEAIGIPVEAGCRYKRRLEKEGYLVQSSKQVVCPFTLHMARAISTNPDEFDKLRRSDSKPSNPEP